MRDSISNKNVKRHVVSSKENAPDLSISELDILRKAYEIILENSNHCFGFSDTALVVKRESSEFNPMI